jgi:hypothetical protein
MYARDRRANRQRRLALALYHLVGNQQPPARYMQIICSRAGRAAIRYAAANFKLPIREVFRATIVHCARHVGERPYPEHHQRRKECTCQWCKEGTR